MIGQSLGPYVVLDKLGEGGMGEVYRARDPRLKREVAVKVLPPTFDGDADRSARFRREAEVLASLNHPHIAQIYGVEVTDGRLALVMELVEGATLAERLGRGRLPLETAINIATQIADGLEAAHERGIVHRDLKPANIKVRTDGVVKILDFGLAKSLAPAPAATGMRDTAESPTHTSPTQITGQGVVLGTAAYMAPEQARGEEAGRPADVWALGCVLYEMVVGASPFAGDSIAEVLSNVLRTDVDWHALPPDTPESIRRLLRRCLVKDPRRRLQHVGDARLELTESLSGDTHPPPSTVSAGHRARWLPWGLAGVATAAALTLAVSRVTPPAATPRVTRLDFNLPQGVEVSTISAPSAVISPDGTKVVFTGQQGGLRRLYVRNLSEPEARVFVSTDASSQCYFSADGSAVTYVSSDRTVRRLSLADGLSTVLVRGVDRNLGASWGDDGLVTYLAGGALHQVPATGNGTPRQISTVDQALGELFHGWPIPVPGTSKVLYTVVSGGTRDAHRIDAVDPSTGQHHTVVDVGTYPMLANEGPLVFLRDGVLVAAPIDRERLVLTGPVVKLDVDVALDALGVPLASLSASGNLIYVSAPSASGRLVAVTRDGLATPLTSDTRVYDYPRVSPDGSRIVTFVSGDLWQLDMTRSTLARVTAEAAVGNSYGVWMPDGRRIIYRTATGLRLGTADGGGTSEAIAGTAVTDFPQGVTADGKVLVFTRQTEDAAGEVYTLSLEGTPNPRALFSSPAYEGGGVASPQERWIAYASNESGRYEIYVRPFPEASRKWQVSTDGGTQPMWGRDGRELFYRNGSKMIAVPVDGTDDLRLGQPRVLFDQEFSYGTGITFAQYDVLADGRFVMIKREGPSGRLSIVLNWTAELERMTGGRP